VLLRSTPAGVLRAGFVSLCCCCPLSDRQPRSVAFLEATTHAQPALAAAGRGLARRLSYSAGAARPAPATPHECTNLFRGPHACWTLVSRCHALRGAAPTLSLIMGFAWGAARLPESPCVCTSLRSNPLVQPGAPCALAPPKPCESSMAANRAPFCRCPARPRQMASRRVPANNAHGPLASPAGRCAEPSARQRALGSGARSLSRALSCAIRDDAPNLPLSVAPCRPVRAPSSWRGPAPPKPRRCGYRRRVCVAICVAAACFARRAPRAQACALARAPLGISSIQGRGRLQEAPALAL
jgi:hypothetical protein